MGHRSADRGYRRARAASPAELLRTKAFDRVFASCVRRPRGGPRARSHCGRRRRPVGRPRPETVQNGSRRFPSTGTSAMSAGLDPCGESPRARGRCHRPRRGQHALHRAVGRAPHSNVQGTRHVLATRAPVPASPSAPARQHHVRGRDTDRLIAERLERRAAEFVNAYERTKWQAEQLRRGGGSAGAHCAAQHLHRRRAHRLRAPLRCDPSLAAWLTRGLIPMVPAAPGSRIDLIADRCRGAVDRASGGQAVERLEVCQVAAGHERFRLRSS